MLEYPCLLSSLNMSTRALSFIGFDPFSRRRSILSNTESQISLAQTLPSEAWISQFDENSLSIFLPYFLTPLIYLLSLIMSGSIAVHERFTFLKTTNLSTDLETVFDFRSCNSGKIEEFEGTSVVGCAVGPAPTSLCGLIPFRKFSSRILPTLVCRICS